jgi:hypothetical protein
MHFEPAADLRRGAQMNMKRYLVRFMITFAVTFLVSGAVTLLWNLICNRASTIDWETSFRIAIALGIILPWMGARRCLTQ